MAHIVYKGVKPPVAREFYVDCRANLDRIRAERAEFEAWRAGQQPRSLVMVCLNLFLTAVVMAMVLVLLYLAWHGSAHAQGSFDLPPPLTTDANYNPGGIYNNPLPPPVPAVEPVNTNATPMPEPGAAGLLVMGAAALVAGRRRF